MIEWNSYRVLIRRSRSCLFCRILFPDWWQLNWVDTSPLRLTVLGKRMPQFYWPLKRVSFEGHVIRDRHINIIVSNWPYPPSTWPIFHPWKPNDERSLPIKFGRALHVNSNKEICRWFNSLFSIVRHTPHSPLPLINQVRTHRETEWCLSVITGEMELKIGT